MKLWVIERHHSCYFVYICWCEPLISQGHYSFISLNWICLLLMFFLPLSVSVVRCTVLFEMHNRSTRCGLFFLLQRLGMKHVGKGKGKERRMWELPQTVCSFALLDAVVVTGRKREAALLHFIWQEMTVCLPEQSKRECEFQQKLWATVNNIYSNCWTSQVCSEIIHIHSYVIQTYTFIPHIFYLFSGKLLQRAETMLYCQSHRHMKPLSGTPTVSVSGVWSQPKREKGRGVFSSSSSALKEKQEETGMLFCNSQQLSQKGKQRFIILDTNWRLRFQLSLYLKSLFNCYTSIQSLNHKSYNRNIKKITVYHTDLIHTIYYYCILGTL